MAHQLTKTAAITLLLVPTCSHAADWMSEQKAQDICTDVAQAVSDGSVQSRFVEFQQTSDEERIAWKATHPEYFSNYLASTHRIARGGTTRTFGRVEGGGTCSGCTISEIGVVDAGALYGEEENEVDEDLRWADWGNCDHLVYVMDEPIVVTGRFDGGMSRAGLISWLAPDGTKRELCFLEPTETIKTLTERAEDATMCRAASMNAVELLPWHENVSLTDNQRNELKIKHIRADSAVGTHADINSDGQYELIALLDYASGAGCGSTHQWLLDVTPGLTDSPLNAILRSREWGPVEGRRVISDAAARPSIFRYEGKPYIFGRAEETSAAVVSVWGNELKTWCEYKLLPTHRVKRHYPIGPRRIAGQK